MPASGSVHHPRYAALQVHMREMRESAGLTQADLAAVLRVGQSFISKVERGERYVDVTFYVDWCRSCQLDPPQALAQLLQRTQWDASARARL